jgi:hypothetical protein
VDPIQYNWRPIVSRNGSLDRQIANQFQFIHGNDESDFYDEIFSRWRCSGPKSIDLSTRDKLGIWLNKERLESRFSEDSDIWPSQDEASVALFTNTWNCIASFKKHRNNFTIDCDECFETFTIGETVQVDDNDESIRSSRRS